MIVKGHRTMHITDYSTPAPDDAEALFAAVFGIGKEVRYVAIREGRDVIMRLAEGTPTATTPTSNYFEELLVNPAVLLLTDHRGALDCDGMQYVVIRYGDFQQFIARTAEGHISIGLPMRAVPEELSGRLKPILAAHGALPAGRGS